MGKNTGEGQRIGAVTDRVQYYNPKTKMYVKMDTENNKIISCSKNQYKGVRNGSKDCSDKDDAGTKASDKSDDKQITKATKTTKPSKTSKIK
jgi:hypothetical protein